MVHPEAPEVVEENSLDTAVQVGEEGLTASKLMAVSPSERPPMLARHLLASGCVNSRGEFKGSFKGLIKAVLGADIRDSWVYKLKDGLSGADLLMGNKILDPDKVKAAATKRASRQGQLAPTKRESTASVQPDLLEQAVASRLRPTADRLEQARRVVQSLLTRHSDLGKVSEILREAQGLVEIMMAQQSPEQSK